MKQEPISTHLYELKASLRTLAPIASKEETQKLQGEIEKELKEISDFRKKDNTASDV